MKQTIITLFTLIMLSFNLFGIADFPTKNLEIVVPYSAGGGTDQAARFIGKSAENILGQPVTIINKTGAGGAVGMTFGAKAKPNGYTITMLTVEISILPYLGGMKVTSQDFKPLLQLNSSPAAITVKSDSPFKTLDDLITYAKSNPNTIRIGNSGVGSIWHLAAASISDKANISITPVPFDGAATAIAALLGGHIEAVSVSAQEVQSQVKSGALRILAIMSDERIPGFEEVPTTKELGYDLQIGTWRALAVPANTPDDVVNTLENAFLTATSNEQYIQQMEKAGLSINILNSKDFENKLDKENKLFKKLINKLHLQ